MDGLNLSELSPYASPVNQGYISPDFSQNNPASYLFGGGGMGPTGAASGLNMPALNYGQSYGLNADANYNVDLLNASKFGGKTDPSAWDSFWGSTNEDTGKWDMGWGGQAVGTGLAAANAFLGYKQYNLAKKDLSMRKKQFNKEYAAQRTLTNAELRDRQEARVASGSGYESVDSYMNRSEIV